MVSTQERGCFEVSYTVKKVSTSSLVLVVYSVNGVCLFSTVTPAYLVEKPLGLCLKICDPRCIYCIEVLQKQVGLCL